LQSQDFHLLSTTGSVLFGRASGEKNLKLGRLFAVTHRSHIERRQRSYTLPLVMAMLFSARAEAEDGQN
jgi:hypothetical protein